MGFDFSEQRLSVRETLNQEAEFSGKRQLKSAYFEVLLPLRESFEISLAGRQDDYSDYGSDFSPKLSFNWQIAEQWRFRASLGEGFRAPIMMIEARPVEGGVAFIFNDQASCDAIGQPGECVIFPLFEPVNSPALSSEQSEQRSLGLVWEPRGRFRMSVDYYDIDMDDLLKEFGAEEVLQRSVAGDPLPPGLGVVRDPSGLLMKISAGWGNEGDLETSGFDINANYASDLGPGKWISNLRYSHVLDYSINKGRDRVGDPGRPQARATWTNRYDIGKWGITWNTHYIADQFNEIIDGVGEGHVPSWVTNDMQITWNAPWDGRFTVGVQNVLEKDPPLFVGNRGSFSYDYKLYTGYGRIMYFRYRQQF